MSLKHYVVVRGNEDSYRVIAVTDDKGLAIEYAAEQNRALQGQKCLIGVDWDKNWCSVEEFRELDEIIKKNINK